MPSPGRILIDASRSSPVARCRTQVRSDAWHGLSNRRRLPAVREGGPMFATDAPMVLLRIAHIGTGVLWVGSLFVVVVFVQPSAARSGRRPRRSCPSSVIGALQHRLVVAERVSFSLVLLAVVAMSSARYL